MSHHQGGVAAEQAAFPFRIERFASALVDGAPDPRTRGWFEAVRLGFHEPRPEEDHLKAFVEAHRADGREITGVYDDGERPGPWDPAVPVASYATMTHTVNVGAGRLLDAHQITAVTVRPTHRRRGILRRMMTDDLASAARRGLPLALLTASEATIYGRFGFGAATTLRHVEVDVTERFGITSPPAGRVEVLDPSVIEETARDVFAGFHARHRGSVDRQRSYIERVTARWSDGKPEADRSLRTAVHYDAAGTADGYVAYAFSGWEEPYTVKIVDLVAIDDAARRELWRYLGSLDLVQRIQYHAAPEEDVLPWALSDSRVHAVKGAEDHLWVRVLDPVAALEARGWEDDGAAAVRITDALGHAAGSYRIEVSGGRARVGRLGEHDDVDAVLGVDALGSLYLGGVRAELLAAAGRVEAASSGALSKVDALFRTAARPSCITGF
ncbi:GNAT family N-acetyltransferase [Zafaria sp. Z1313]|uniref:GNAT family N-acetyltransferase n=1 Tax=unclassified Zafaria TaxID=2828765 RepID=UPI002E7769C5|nr:GNAT family N-acetyltransferase [Zafaria sp. J156]MEE1620172.1 GNAT family N-acetyltransferase [Zafaria sp. J156]